MSTLIKLKRSAVAGRVPTTSQLELGELAINTADGKIYIKQDLNGTESIVEFSADPNDLLTLIKTVDGAGSGLDADLLDGLDSLQFLRSDQDDTFDGNLVITSNLTVSGNTTQVNTETLTVEDNIITLNSTTTGTPSENAGIEVERGDSSNVALRWNESDDDWEVTTDGSNYYNISTAADSFKTSIGDGSATSYTVTHNLGSRDVLVELYDASSYETVIADVTRTSTSVVTVAFTVAPSSNDIRVLIRKI